VHDAAENVPPDTLAVNVTVPVGAEAVPALLSVIMTVRMTCVDAPGFDELEVMLVVVVRFAIVSTPAPLLVVWGPFRP